MRILALTRYGPLAASTRQRFLQYRPALAAAGITLDAAPLMDDEHMRRLVRGQGASVVGTALAVARRVRTLLNAGHYDLLWIHCESFPYLPGFLEMLAFRAGRPVVYDYDDAIFHIYDSNASGFVRRLLGRKLEPLLMRVDACTCGNAYLADYAGRFCRRTLIVPTIVDTDTYVPVAERAEGPVTIGWIGSPSTWPQLRPLLPLLRSLCAAGDVRFRAVGTGAAARADIFLGMDLIPWDEATEIAEVQAMDIGIMPLTDAPFTRGKSGYKLIQYMACGLPLVATPIGVNAEIVEEGENGLLASSEAEWRCALEKLIASPAVRNRMGKAGRAKAVESYSLQSQAPRLIGLFRSLAG